MLQKQGSSCAAVTKAGRPCRAAALPGELYCLFHSPVHREQVRAGRARGGQLRRRQVAPAARLDEVHSVGDVVTLVADELRQCRQACGPGVVRARAVAYLAAVMIKALEVSEIESRVQRLEQALLPRQGGQR